MSKVSYLIEFTINDGEIEVFKNKAAGFTTSVKENEPSTLVYQWWLQEEGNRCLLHEVFDSSEALLTHLGNVGPSLPDLLAIAPITRFEVFGNASEQARGAIRALGAVHFLHLGGFER